MNTGIVGKTALHRHSGGGDSLYQILSEPYVCKKGFMRILALRLDGPRAGRIRERLARDFTILVPQPLWPSK